MEELLGEGQGEGDEHEGPPEAPPEHTMDDERRSFRARGAARRGAVLATALRLGA
jgi:hypothetical protein